MPLSEQEQRLLDEMERHLMRNDADVVSAPRDGRTLSYRNIVYGTILGLSADEIADLRVVARRKAAIAQAEPLARLRAR